MSDAGQGVTDAVDGVAAVLSTEFSETFVRGMRDRMLVSYYKYGAIAQAYPHRVNALASLLTRLRIYAGDSLFADAYATAMSKPHKIDEEGNTEYLMDAGNFAMIEFMHPRIPGAHYKPTDSDGSPGRIGHVTGRATTAKNKDIFIDETLTQRSGK